MTIYGPYRHSTGNLKGRAYICIRHPDGKRTTKLYSRYLLEQELGRELSYDETVDHINGDFTDDSLENLQVLSRSENAAKGSPNRKSIEWVTFQCPVCGTWTEKNARIVRGNRKKGKAGPFCGRSCAGKYSTIPS